MKIKNLKYSLSVALLSGVLTLTGCNSNNTYNEEELLASIETLEEENQKLIEENQALKNENVESKPVEPVSTETELEETVETFEDEQEVLSEVSIQLTEDEISALANELEYELDPQYYFYSIGGKVSIAKKTYVEDDYFQISDEVYSKLNLLLQNSSSLELEDLDNKFDISKLDITNLDSIDFNNLKFEYIKPLLLIAASNEILVDWRDVYDNVSSRDAIQIVDFLTENKIKLGILDLSFDNCQSFLNICDKLQDLNAEFIYFTVNFNSSDVDKKIDIVAKFNDNTFSVDLDLNYTPVVADDYYLVELGNICFYSSNSSFFDVTIENSLVTENTNFSIFNDNAFVYLSNCRYTDINPFYGLSNVYEISYTDGFGKRISYSDNSVVISEYDAGGMLFETEYENASFDDAISMIQGIHDKAYVKKK